MIFGYARVSTLDQNLDTQIEVLKQEGCDEIFEDKISGVATARPQLDALLNKVREGDTILVARFNRLGRSRNHLIELLSVFKERGINFKALDLGVDSNTPSGKMVLQIFAALSEYERESILEKTKLGQKLAKENGVHMGRPSGVDPKNLERVRKAHFEERKSVATMVFDLNIPRSTIKRYLRILKE